MRRSIRVHLLVAILVFVLLPAFALAKAKVEMKIDTHEPDTGLMTIAYKKFKEIVEKRTNGDVKVKLYLSSQLGYDMEVYEACQKGHLKVATGSDSNITQFSNVFEAFHLPFFFLSLKQYDRAFDSPKVKAYIDKELGKSGFKYLGSFSYGTRQLATTKKRQVFTPDDCKGLKLRAANSVISVASHESWGALSSQIRWPECYDALKTGVVDGVTVNFSSYYMTKLDEVLTYMAEINWSPFANVFVANKDWWDNKVPENLKPVILESHAETREWFKDFSTDYQNKTIKKMIDRQKGRLIVYRPTAEQITQFEEKSKAVWKKFEKDLCPKEFQDLLKKEMGANDGSGWGYKW